MSHIGARLPAIALALVPAAITVYLAVSAGGFFAGTPAAVAIVLLLLLAARVLLVPSPAAGFSAWSIVAATALGLFAVWTLVSGSWSGASGRALVEFDRALLYALALVVFGSVARESWRLRWMLRGLAVAAVAICVAGLATRLLPDVWPLELETVGSRLSYPLRYWNTFGLLAALGIIVCFGLTCDGRESRLGRILGAAAVPILASALLLTLSRGSIAAAILGLAVFIVVGHPRHLLGGLVAVAPATAFALVATYDADLLVSAQRLTGPAQDQGHHLAVVIAVCAAGAAGLRTLLLPADGAVARLRPTLAVRRMVLGSGMAIVVTAVIAVALAIDVPRQYDRFLGREIPARTVGERDERARLTNVASPGRLVQWRIAADGYEANPLRGRGAGTFELSWDRHRPDIGDVRDAHSLYVEVLGELGIVGLALLLVCIATILVGTLLRGRGREWNLHATIFAAMVAWIAAAGIDWHWEMPVVTLWFFALGGAAIARGTTRDDGAGTRFLAPMPRVALVGLLCLLVVLVPLRLVISEDQLTSALAAPGIADCEPVNAFAERSISAVSSRPQPYEIKARCELEAGRTRAAIELMTEAVDKDPGNWRPRYGLAVARARAGLDPRPDARAALKLNPRERTVVEAVAGFERTTGASAWRATSQALRVLTPSR